METLKTFILACVLALTSISASAALTPGLYTFKQYVYRYNTTTLIRSTVFFTNVSKAQCASYIAPNWPSMTVWANPYTYVYKCVLQK